MKHVTLLFLLKDDTKEICLAMKKRGFGEGKLNGTGGKIEDGETVLEAAAREAREEIGVEVAEDDMEHVATIAFSFDGKPDWGILGSVFLATQWQGEPAESEEMAPQWFTYDTVPYNQMWVNDRQWVPQVLAGKKLKGSIHFTEDGNTVISESLQEVATLSNILK